MEILAGDIGGTKTVLALAEVKGRHVEIVQERRFASRDYPDFVPLVRQFLPSLEKPVSSACFGVAGPVVQGRTQVTKLPWVLDEADLAGELGIERVRLLNDFAATAYGIDALEPEDFETLNPGQAVPGGHIALLGAGTGLGEAMILQSEGRRIVLASEGGHSDFAPRNEIECEFLLWMTAKYGRVSYDRVVSGPGLVDIYTFLRDSGRGEESVELRQALELGHDRAAVIHQFADSRKDPLCEATLGWFVSIYGAEAGNLALKAVATGGVYVAGGIAPRLAERLKAGEFRKSFVTKGRLSPLLRSIPVRVIMNPKAGLLGAALVAARP